MSFRWLPLLLVSVVAAISLAHPRAASAQGKLGRLLPFKWVEADPEKSYDLTENNGPWTIMAASFRGEHAAEDAQDLVYELRKKYKLPAYTYRKKFALEKTVEGRGLNKYGDIKRMKYQTPLNAEEIAVLVGDYPSVDDKQAQKILKQIKYLRPIALDPKKKPDTSQALADVRAFYKAHMPAGSDRAQRGPMASAFVITNPLLPKEYFAPRGVDPLVVQMNKGVKHTLLECQHKYTVKVATFGGAVLIDQKMVKAAEEGAGTFKSQLENAADKAHTMTEALRAKGVEAYEFHDRYQSIVTVGGFDSVGAPRDDGKIEINPAVHAIMKTYGADTEQTARGGPAGGVQGKNIKGIPYDISPIPVEIPHRSLSMDYARSSGGDR